MGSYTCTCVPPYAGDGRICGGELFFTVKRLFLPNIFYADFYFHPIRRQNDIQTCCTCNNKKLPKKVLIFDILLSTYVFARLEATEPSTTRRAIEIKDDEVERTREK